MNLTEASINITGLSGRDLVGYNCVCYLQSSDIIGMLLMDSFVIIALMLLYHKEVIQLLLWMEKKRLLPKSDEKLKKEGEKKV